MKIIETYTKDFSQIGKLQQNETIIYNLTQTDNTQQNLYGIEIISQISQKRTTFSYPKLSSQKNLVSNLLKYLHQNSVKAELCKDVIQDIMGMSTDLI